MNPPCKVCDMHTASHHVTDADNPGSSWLMCEWCVHQAARTGMNLRPVPITEHT